jgi:hypothetical protein
MSSAAILRTRLFNDAVGDFRFSFEYYYAHIMRPFREYVLDALALIEPLPTAPDRPGARPDPAPPAARLRASLPRTGHAAPVQRGAQREDAGRLLHLGLRQHPAHGRSARRRRRSHRRRARLALRPRRRRVGIFTDLIEEADGLAFGSPTINGDAVKPVWDLLSSLTTVNVKGKLGAAFGSYGWSGEAVRLIEDRLRGLKLRVPVEGLRIKLVPDRRELGACHDLGEQLARHLTGQVEHRGPSTWPSARLINNREKTMPKPKSPFRISASPSPYRPAPA